jgi:hypothetical protein
MTDEWKPMVKTNIPLIFLFFLLLFFPCLFLSHSRPLFVLFLSLFFFLLRQQGISSDAPQLEGFISSINVHLLEQLEQGQPPSITNLFNMVALEFNEILRSMFATQPHQPGVTFHSNFIPTEMDDEEEEEEEVGGGGATGGTETTGQGSENPPMPTNEDWQLRILPALRTALLAENFMAYEIEEWLRRVEIKLNHGDPKGALHMIQYEILGGSAPPAIRRYFPKRRYLRQSVS